MNDQEKSDGPVVPGKSPNKLRHRRRAHDHGEPYAGTKAATLDTAKGEPTAMRDECAGAEAMEGRGPTKGNADEQNAHRTQRRIGAPSALDRVREAARRDRKARFTALFHHVTIDALRDAFFSLKKRAAPGVDRVTWEQYAVSLEERLKDLHGRLHHGAYRAKPSRRVAIPKADGRQRLLGIASLEDKIVQRAVVEVMNAIYEVDFLGFSYGFRTGRSQHNALDALYIGIQSRKVNWVLDADVRGFFDAVDHAWLIKFVEHRIADKRIVRLIQKWLSAGVLDDGKWTQSIEGTPQGATASPLLANIYLHYVLDLWAHRWRKKRAHGDMIIVRYADDFVIGFQHQADAEQFRRDLVARLREFSLELHPDKTRLIRFGRFAAQQRAARGEGKPETFDFLGFTHVCSEGRVKGYFVLRRLTVAKRMRAKLREVKEELMRRRHEPVSEQGKWLGAVVRGYLQYHAVPLNFQRMRRFREETIRHWRRALTRRSQKGRVTWTKINRLVTRWIPLARILHPWPHKRLRVLTQGRSPVR